LEKEKQQQYIYYEEDEIDLYELWLTLKRRKKIIFGITGLFTVIAIVLCFILPPTYKTETTLMPLGGKSTGGLSSLLSSLPISVPIPTGSESGITVEAVLKSRILRERVIKDLNLLPKLFPDKWDPEKKQWILEGEEDTPPTILDGAEVLDKLISVSTDKKTGVITLSVEFKKDPKLAYDIANAILKEADTILNEKSFSLARKYRMYIEKQLKIAREKLQKMEEIYKERKINIPSIYDMIESLRFLFRFFIVMLATVPESDIFHSSAAAFCGIPCVIGKLKYGSKFLLTEHGIYAREQYLYASREGIPYRTKEFLLGLIGAIVRLNYCIVAYFPVNWKKSFTFLTLF